jgi:hypothetical protein
MPTTYDPGPEYTRSSGFGTWMSFGKLRTASVVSTRLAVVACVACWYTFATSAEENSKIKGAIASSTVLVTDAMANFAPVWCGETGVLIVNTSDRLAYVDVRTKASEQVSASRIHGDFFCSHDGLLIFFRELAEEKPSAESSMEGAVDVTVINRETKIQKKIRDFDFDLFYQPLSPTAAIAVAAGSSRQEAEPQRKRLASVLSGWKIVPYWLPSVDDYRLSNSGVWATDGSYFVVPGITKSGDQDRNILKSSTGQTIYEIPKKSFPRFQRHALPDALYGCEPGGIVHRWSIEDRRSTEFARLSSMQGRRFSCRATDFDVSANGSIAFVADGLLERRRAGPVDVLDVAGRNPRYSRDGRHLAYLRAVSRNGSLRGELVVLRAER